MSEPTPNKKENARLTQLINKCKPMIFSANTGLQNGWDKLIQKPRHVQVIIVFLISLLLAIFLLLILLPITASYIPIFEKIITGNGIWTLITVFLSAPVAFFIWKFRDENTIRQLESQRKDVNLKEFQKIAEWVSGLHLTEDKITEKNKSTLKGESAKLNEETETVHKSESAVLSTETETTREYGQAGKNRHIRTPSREDGTAGLQVAAVYMLRPFFCGEHGDGFREPALNLLTATWLALFKPIEQQFKEAADANEQKRIIEQQRIIINKVVASPLAVALNQVLLADGGKPLSRFPHIFPNLYLPGLQLNQPGVDQQVKTFWQGRDCSGIQLWGANLQGANLYRVNLQGADLQGVNLQRADLQGANLQGANLQRADLQGALLQEVLLQEAQLQRAQLQMAQLQEALLPKAQLQRADLQGADLEGADLQEAKLQGAKLQGVQLQRADLQGAKLQGAKLQEAKLRGVQLQRADLQGAKLQGADLLGAKLQGAKLQGADLLGAKLQEAKLQGAQLQKANLQKANLQKANLHDADLQETELQCAVVLDTDIDHSKELQNVADLIVLVTEQPEQIYELIFEGEGVSIDVMSAMPINLEATREKNLKWKIEEKA